MISKEGKAYECIYSATADVYKGSLTTEWPRVMYDIDTRMREIERLPVP